MKVILLLAGRGARLLPLTETTPKPLLPVAGAPVLEHILKPLESLPIDELIAVTGHLGEQFDRHLRERYRRPYRILKQARLDGTGGAVATARDHIDCPVLVIFGDTIFKADLSHLSERSEQNVIWTQTVQNYERFGIVQTDERGDMERIVEKPQQDVGRKANIGLYYISDHQALRASLDRVMSGSSIKGEYYFTYALNDMAARGRSIKAREADGWYDCGDLASLLDANRRLLAADNPALPTGLPGVTIVPPVSIHGDARLRDCRIGPNASIGSGSLIVSSSVSDAIVACNCRINKAVIRRSIVGDGEKLTNISFHGSIAAHGKIVQVD